MMGMEVSVPWECRIPRRRGSCPIRKAPRLRCDLDPPQFFALCHERPTLRPVEDEAARAWMRALYEARFARGLGTAE